MRTTRIICVGKIKTDYLKQAWLHYLRLLEPMRMVEVTEVKDGESSLDAKSRCRKESERILACLDRNDMPIAMWEKGQMPDSREFAAILRDCEEQQLKRPTFIIGGPFGLAEELLHTAALKLSLSRMTWPHEIARVLLIEQIYRAETILRHSPYHH